MSEEETQNQTQEPFLTEDEQRFLASLLANPQVCSVLQGFGDKALAAMIQQKVTDGTS